MKPVDLAELRRGLRGRRYAALVEAHVRSKGARGLQAAGLGTGMLLPREVQPLVMGFIDRWNVRVYDRAFWDADCAPVFDEIVEDARTVLRTRGLPADDETLSDLFQIVTLNDAYSASDQRKIREFMRIRRSWWRR